MYVLPPDIASTLEEGRLQHVASGVAVERGNYRRRMHNCLFVEEYQRRKATSRHNLMSAALVATGWWEASDGKVGGKVMYAAPGQVLVKVHLQLDMTQSSTPTGGSAIKPGDRALLRPVAQHRTAVYAGLVESVGLAYVILSIQAEVVTRLQAFGEADSLPRCDVRFALDRTALVAMHQAVDQVNLSLVFPDLALPRPCAWQHHEGAGDRVPRDCLPHACLDAAQASVVSHILSAAHAGGGGVGVPLLVSGAFGTGKSRVIEEAITLIVQQQPRCRVLLCTAHDSTADAYVLRLAALLKPEEARRMLRVCDAARPQSDISDSVGRYCVTSVTAHGTQHRRISRHDVVSSSILVTTMLGAHEVVRCGVGAEGFSHIIIDEAAQVPEPLVLIALSLASRRTKVVLAGDHKQLGSWEVTPVARRLGLALSIIQRMVSLPVYQSGGGGGGL